MRGVSSSPAVLLLLLCGMKSEGQLVNMSLGQPAVDKSLAVITPRLGGSFIQVLEEHGNWNSARWDQLFETLNRAGIHELIVQWTVLNGVAIYPSRAFRSIANAPLENILARADAAGMRVLIGLVHETDYWTNIQHDPAAVSAYLSKLRTKSELATHELALVVKSHPSFAGWYVPEEVDDVNWRKPEARKVLFTHISALARELRKETPKATIAISAFSQGKTSPDAYRQFWDDFFQAASLNTVLFQDGLGVNKLDLHEVPMYLQPLRDAADKHGRTVQCVVELFRQVAGIPIDNSEFKAVPGPIARIREQLGIAARFSTGQIVGFSVPEYMTPAGGEAASQLLGQYLALVGSVSSGNQAADKQDGKQ